MFGLRSKIENISVRAIESEMKNGAVLVDIRNDQAFKSGHIEGAINIPIRALAANMDSLNKDQTILVICYVGGSSKMAASLLNKSGFTVKNVVGGMQAWTGKVVQ